VRGEWIQSRPPGTAGRTWRAPARLRGWAQEVRLASRAAEAAVTAKWSRAVMRTEISDSEATPGIMAKPFSARAAA